MNQVEQTRLRVFNSVFEHRLTIALTAEVLGVSKRHSCSAKGRAHHQQTQ